MTLTIKKQTIANLDALDMKQVKGGALTHYSAEVTGCPSCYAVCQQDFDDQN